MTRAGRDSDDALYICVETDLGGVKGQEDLRTGNKYCYETEILVAPSSTLTVGEEVMGFWNYQHAQVTLPRIWSYVSTRTLYQLPSV